MKNKKLLLGIGVLALVLAAGFLASGRSIQGSARNTASSSSAPVTLTFAPSSNPVVGGEIVAGEQTSATAVLVARYQVTASAPASNKVTINSLTLENDYDDQNPLVVSDAAVSQVSLHFPNSYSRPTVLNGVATATLTDEGYAEFNGLNFKIPGNAPVQFEVKVVTNPIGGDVAAGDQIELDFSPKAYTATNDRSGAAIQGEVLPDGIDGPEFTLVAPEPAEPVTPTPQGALTISAPSGVPTNQNGNITINSNPSVYDFSGSGNNQHFIAQYNVSSSGERFNIDTITVSIASGETAIQNLYIRYPNYSSTGVYSGGGGQEKPATTITNGEATFSNLNMWTPHTNQPNQNWFIIKAVLKPLGQGSNAGDLVEVDIPLNGTVGSFSATGQTSGAFLYQPNGNTADVDGPNKTIVAASTPPPPPPPPPPSSTGNYAGSPTGTGNSAAASPTVNLLVNGENGPASVNSGASVLLSWTSTNATNCTASGMWVGSKPLNGSETLTNRTVSGPYNITCYNGGPYSFDSDSVTVNVTSSSTYTPPPGTGSSAAGYPTVNLLINGSSGPVNINSGASITLSWTTANAMACIAEANPSGAGTWSGSRATSGSETLNQITTSRNYMLTCWSGNAPSEGTTTTDPVMVNVAAATPPPPSSTGNSAAASPTVNLLVNGGNGPITTTGSVAQGGGSVYINWNNSNVSSSMGGSCTKSSSVPTPAWNGTMPSWQNASGGTYIGVPTSRTFTMSCTTSAGTAQDSMVVNVPN